MNNVCLPSRRRRVLAIAASTFTCAFLGTVPAHAADELSEELLDSFSWRAIGPSATGGRIIDIDVDPENRAHVYAASASGGLWMSPNGGTTWECIFENEGVISIGDIAVDPNNGDVIWVGTGEANNQRSSYWGDGIYKTTDRGTTWTNVGLPDSHHIGRIIVDPNDSDRVFVAALGALYSANPERGVYRTTDGGATWEHVLFVNKDTGVVDIVMHPDNSDVLFAASYERRRRAWDFDGNGPGSGIWKSEDGGDTWTRLEGGLPSGDIGRIGLAMTGDDSPAIFATVANQNLAPDQDAAPRPERRDADEDAERDSIEVGELGFSVAIEEGLCVIKEIERRSNAQRSGLREGDVVLSIGGRDPSKFWTLLQIINDLKPGDSVEIVYERNGGSRTTSITTPVPRPRQVGGEIYRSDDNGATWTKVNEQPVGGSPAYYYGQIRVDPSNSDRLFLTSVPLYVSDDGGKTWSRDGAPTVHVDHHAVWINPDNSNHIYLGNDGGFHTSFDGAKTWVHNCNLPLPQFYAINVDMQKPYHVYGGTQDNGTWGGPSRSRGRGVGRAEWEFISGGDGFYICIDPNDPDIVISESQFGVIGRSDRGTGDRVSIRPPQSEPGGAPDRYNWNSPIIMSTHNPSTIYFGGNKLFKSYNRGDDWLVISPDLTTADPARLAGNVPHCTITTIAESPLDPDVLIVGTDDGLVHWSNDGGASWRDLSNRFPMKPASWWVSRVEASKRDVNTAYVTFTGYREDDFRPFVFMTRDGGNTWTNIGGDLPEGPVNVIREDPVNRNLLYVGTEFGVFVSLDDGAHWHAFGDGLPTIAVHDLVVHPRDHEVVAGTHGRGFFIAPVAALQQMSSEVLSADAHLFTPPTATAWKRGGRSWQYGDQWYTASNPPYGAEITYHLAEELGDKKASIVIRNEGGNVVGNLDVKKEAGVHIDYWNLRNGRSRGLVPPGRYEVTLTVGDWSSTRAFTVEPDPLDVR